ncbi:mannosyl-oligosaccharide alpha-1,2-mannosidase [Entomophthora muscae]|uniref:Mannosyl-oligosaccharide alpha-1,2-mannosidase n=1 Tax=Entomophthora muscae TaxID=34485 RepID=A0ACC2RLN8_9FUNG|nr:mannosyl-oligosaccharide alpha-1,2-mannosidase [Entomophthora muscae]
MGLEDEYNRAKVWIESSLDFNQHGNVNVFETTIRVLGGLLSSYHLKKDAILLEKAVQLGDRLAKGFNTRSGIPIPTINLKTGAHSRESLASTAEATTLQLENKYLSYLTNNRTYWDLSQRVNDIVAKQKSLDGLVPIYISVGTGEFSSDEIRLGSRGDSYYEYLLKQWLITSKMQPEFRTLYDDLHDRSQEAPCRLYQ